MATKNKHMWFHLFDLKTACSSTTETLTRYDGDVFNAPLVKLPVEITGEPFD